MGSAMAASNHRDDQGIGRGVRRVHALGGLAGADGIGRAAGLGRASLPLLVVPPFLAALTTAAVLGWGGLARDRRRMTLGTLVAFQSADGRASSSRSGLVAPRRDAPGDGGDLGRLDDVLANPVDARSRDVEARTGARLQGALELRDVTFGYNIARAALLEEFNLTLRPGERVALVGAIGVRQIDHRRLVAGLYSRGAARSSSTAARGRTGRATRSPRLWRSSTRTSSCSAAPCATTSRCGTRRFPTARVVRPRTDAAIHDQIARRPGGYDRGRESGANFSGGERSDSRSPVRWSPSPRMLVLDEATSALDPSTERSIDGDIRRRGCTTLIVAHRLRRSATATRSSCSTAAASCSEARTTR